MIRRQGEYLIADEPFSPASEPKIPEAAKSVEVFQAEGTIKERLQLIKQEIEKLKQQRRVSDVFHKSERDFLEKTRSSHKPNSQAVNVNLKTPDFLFKLINRVEELETKVGKAELYNQIVHKKGSLNDRIKVLQMRINKVAELSTETIIKNISNYCSLIEEREEHFKFLFLYEQFMKTQGLKEDYQVVRQYLLSLKSLHEEGSTIPSNMIKLTTVHNDILAKTAESEKQIVEVYNKIAEQYRTIIAELDELEKSC